MSEQATRAYLDHIAATVAAVIEHRRQGHTLTPREGAILAAIDDLAALMRLIPPPTSDTEAH